MLLYYLGGIIVARGNGIPKGASDASELIRTASQILVACELSSQTLFCPSFSQYPISL